MLTKEADEAMKPCDFDSYSLCMFAGYAEDDGQPDEIVTTRNEALEVKYDDESLLEEEGVDLLQQKEFIDEILFGVKQSNEVDVDNSMVGLQKGKPMNLFNGIDERCLQYDNVENKSIQKDCQEKEKNEAEKENCDDLLERFHKEIEFLERLLEEPKGETKLTEPDGGKGVEDRINKYDAEIREIEQRLYEGEMKDQKQQGGYVLKGIKETKILTQQDECGSNQKFGRNDQLHENEFEEGIKL